MRGTQAGFTLLEVMIACVIVAVLAAIALPTFSSESRRARAETEIGPMFAELAVREEQYKVDAGRYLSAPSCPGAPSEYLQDASACVAGGQIWNTLRVQLPSQQLRCSYEMRAGTATDKVTNPNGFAFSSPPMTWYYIIATCEMDGESSLRSEYFTSSVDAAIQSRNVGS